LLTDSLNAGLAGWMWLGLRSSTYDPVNKRCRKECVSKGIVVRERIRQLEDCGAGKLAVTFGRRLVSSAAR